MTLRDAPATGRNREPIGSVLERWLAPDARVLELASGTGQHAIFFAERMPGLAWIPTDIDPLAMETIVAWTKESGLANIAPPVTLDARASDWPVDGSVDAVFNANMIHISPWSVALGLLNGTARILNPGGLLFLYGPFKVDGEHTSPSNAAFDQSLQTRDPSWGIRDLETVVAEAGAVGLALIEANDLPANNKLLVFRRG